MANDCIYEMKVVGKKENIKKLIKMMQCNYSYNTMKFPYEKHIGGRVFEAYESEIEHLGDDRYEVYIYGSCAWSVACCMLDIDNGYYQTLNTDYGDECRSTTLEIESKLLNLEIEVFSTEPGCGFAEHYLIRDGQFEVTETASYQEYYLGGYQTKEEAESDLNISITDEEWKNDEYISRGGFCQEAGTLIYTI